MFGNTAEKRIVREADKVASLLEDLDALSWSRVLEIGKLLQSEEADSRYTEAGGELVAIARSNLSLASRLGFQPVSPETRLTSAGMEITDKEQLKKLIEETDQDAVATDEKDASSPITCKLDDPFETTEDSGEDVCVEPEALSKIQTEEEPTRPVDCVEQEQEQEQEQEAAQPQPCLEAESIAAFSSTQATADAESEVLPPCNEAKQSSSTKKDATKKHFSRFRNLYASRDGGLSVFEDEHGHLVAVDSSRLV